jgi:RNA polymerase sigma-70 factor (ECF subfamily)
MVDAKILLKCAKDGNADSFGALYSMYAKELYLYAYKFLGNKEDAEDAVQQASLNVYKNIASVKNADSFKAYYFKALSNTAKSMLAKKNLHIVGDEELENAVSPEQTEINAINSSVLEKALSALKQDDREIVLLSVLSGFSSKEIAKITGYTSSTVRSKIARSLKKLRTELE